MTTITLDEYHRLRQDQQPSKYRNRKTVVDNIVFDSEAEARRYGQLKLALQAGTITDLELQPTFLLLEGFRDQRGTRHRSIWYIADFKYMEEGKTVVEDVKGKASEAFRIKAKLFVARYPGIDFRVVKGGAV